jgi:hypothetical protein
VKRLAALAGAAVVLCAAAAPADARIVIGRSIAGIKPTASEARFRAVLGPPDGPRDFGDEPADYGLDFRDGRYHGLFISKTHRAELISTTSRSQRTKSGVGPGVSARFARAVLKGERCGSYYDADRDVDATQCTIRTGVVETYFNIAGGRVFEVVVDTVGG